jgi:hypothetical protein
VNPTTTSQLFKQRSSVERVEDLGGSFDNLDLRRGFSHSRQTSLNNTSELPRATFSPRDLPDISEEEEDERSVIEIMGELWSN